METFRTSVPSRFDAQLSILNGNGTGETPVSLIALIIPSNAELENNQTVSIIAASVAHVSSSDNRTTQKK